MKNFYVIILMAFAFAACTDEKTDETTKPAKKENLVEVKNGQFTEWYPGKKQIKFQGMQDKKGERNGKWTFYSENGTELSFTIYEHGVKQGFTVVKYPTGRIHYTGEYLNDKTVGIWKTYDEKGKLVTEKDFGYPAE